MKKRTDGISRRDFVTKSVSGSLFLGIGCPGLFAIDNLKSESNSAPDIHKFQSPVNLSYEKLFNFTFKSWFISYMKRLMKEIGAKKFIKLLTKVGDDNYRNSVGSRFKKVKDRSVQSLIENFWEPTKNSKFGSSIMTVEIPEKSKNKCTVKMTECLFAKTFRENDAGEIGYAAICHADFAVAEAFNPDIILRRDKCLMKGDECCQFNYSMGKKS